MKVKELIEKLKQFDGELPVCVAENTFSDESGTPMFETEFDQIGYLELGDGEYYNHQYQLTDGKYVAINY